MGLELTPGGLDAAIVLGGERRGQQIQDAVGGAQGPGLVRDEGAAVVGLEDQRRAVLPEQLAEVEDGRVGVLGGAGGGQEQEVAGQVAGDQDVVEDAVDRGRGLREVGGPDGAGGGPRQPARLGDGIGDIPI